MDPRFSFLLIFKYHFVVIMTIGDIRRCLATESRPMRAATSSGPISTVYNAGEYRTTLGSDSVATVTRGNAEYLHCGVASVIYAAERGYIVESFICSLFNHAQQLKFTCRVVHSIPLMMSAVQVSGGSARSLYYVTSYCG